MHHFNHLGYVSEYIRSFGYLSPVVTFLLFVIQAAVPVFPYAVLVAAAVIIFGVKMGFLLSLAGAMGGSAICFWLCRKFGSDWFNEKILRRWGYDSSKINSGMAFGGIVVAHLVPVFPSAIITMAAAMSRMSFISFTVSTTLGLIPATLLYTGLGWYLFQIQNIHKALFILVMVLMILYLGKNMVKSWLIAGNEPLNR